MIKEGGKKKVKMYYYPDPNSFPTPQYKNLLSYFFFSYFVFSQYTIFIFPPHGRERKKNFLTVPSSPLPQTKHQKTPQKITLKKSDFFV